MARSRSGNRMSCLLVGMAERFDEPLMASFYFDCSRKQEENTNESHSRRALFSLSFPFSFLSFFLSLSSS